ncbi:MAG: DUF4038 domain-containing protein [Oscillospiraceae bacterium]|nr:DUF4038 domain-containing protein [Oscillospiraceae bacterium]
MRGFDGQRQWEVFGEARRLAIFLLADTAWELFHRLNREEAVEYLATRASQRFTVIQAVALSEFDGLSAPNAYGRTPLLKDGSGRYDPAQPDLRGAGAGAGASVRLYGPVKK